MPRARTLGTLAAAALVAAAAGACGPDAASPPAAAPSASASAPAAPVAYHGDCLTTLGEPSATLQSTAPNDTSSRNLYVTRAAAAFRDENDDPASLLTARGTSQLTGLPMAAAAEGFLWNDAGDKTLYGPTSMLRPDGAPVWSAPEVRGQDGERVGVVGDTVLYGTDESGLVARSAETGKRTKPPAGVTDKTYWSDLNSGQRQLNATPTTLVPTTPTLDANGFPTLHFLDTVSGKVLALPDRHWWVETSSGSSLVIVDQGSEPPRRAVVTPAGMSAPWPAEARSSAGLCNDVLYTMSGDTLTVSTLAAPTKALSTVQVSNPGDNEATVLAAPGAVAVMFESGGGDGGGNVATITLFTK